jgi:hypothetical protein
MLQARRPGELAYTGLFLTSDEARAIHAAEIFIDGGLVELSDG